jgi:hypothetical protein
MVIAEQFSGDGRQNRFGTPSRAAARVKVAMPE